jgi:hypothetical protein
VLNEGYWRPTQNSDRIFECSYPEACLGGYDSDCLDGYEGNMCNSCISTPDKHTAKFLGEECGECPSNKYEMMRLAALIFAY